MNAPLFFILTWIFVFFHVSVCLQKDTPDLYLDNTVFVAFAGEYLSIGCTIMKSKNQSVDWMTCFDPFKKLIYRRDIPAVYITGEIRLTVKLRNVTISGEYVCEYHNTKVFWFLQVRNHGYKEPRMLGNTEIIPVAVITAMLLVFSVAGSVYVFRGNWKEQITKCGKTGGKQKQIGEERKTSETEEDTEIITAPSASFYCSLQPRPRSIYDSLEHLGAEEQDQRKTKPDKTEPPNMIQPTIQLKDEDVFESVYENY
ncbi:uncharacterized protein si:ch211-243a20.4 [Solea solea]|uniref:uncharacterized protein si:ch211-243a20.4 n=1 Tax=Solea solea TaxID=90069 RepID=UPI002729A37C|nr:uncharacterized protein si:ch211-243a20.4 [Solea solea]